MSRPAVFLDRDGTINVNVHHLHRVEDLQLIPGSVEAIAILNAAGYAVVVITNQSAIARGLLTEDGLSEIHRELKRLLSRQHAVIDAIYHCAHHPDYGERIACDCRKPSPNMLLTAAKDNGLDLSCSFMVGDNLSDLESGWRAGCRSALVRTGHGNQVLKNADEPTRNQISYVGSDLLDVAKWITEKHPTK
ncbi:MAG: D-glycero-beta-D-manno-heptose 1,7-bisphosphate 7-phosphatase [bacterium]|jgi:D-glycero-D-manno-heptose 1,7-bisphosphate phosphatase|nr:D-glycero-beta-D-manno-heptose 1,7-bisphosphate 7-phosphatase [bacterium]